MKKIIAILCLLGVFFISSVKGQNEKFKALFIYNFTNYIEWPQNGASSFVIAVMGESPMIHDIEAIAKIKTIGNLPIKVLKINSPSEIGDANIVYIPPSKKRSLPSFLNFLKDKPVLIISDGAKGGFGINFVKVQQKQSFQISRSNIEAHHLKVNSTLVALGISVH